MDKTRFKAILTVAIIVLAGSLGVIFTAAHNNNGGGQTISYCLLIDYGDWNVDYYEQENPDSSVRSELNDLQSKSMIAIQWEGNSIKSINGKENTDVHKWGLWGIKNGSNTYVKLGDDYNTRFADYAICTVCYSLNGAEPAPGTDYLGNCIYGLRDAKTTVTLSPAVTEIASALKAVDTIVGSDTASDYPKEFVDRKNSGKVEMVADMMNVSFEKVIAVNPDVAFFDGSVTNSIDVAKRINKSTSVNSIVIYPGNTIREALNNIFIVGTCLGDEYKQNTISLLRQLSDELDRLIDITSKQKTQATGVVLMCETGMELDWAAGKGSNVRGYIVEMNGNYGLDSIEGTWAEINYEKLVETDPDYIIIISNTYKGQQGYHDILDIRAEKWGSLKAYQNGDIYLMYDQANNITSRMGPRYVQCCEIFAKYMYPDLFAKKLPKYIGDDYVDYLEITSEVKI